MPRGQRKPQRKRLDPIDLDNLRSLSRTPAGGTFTPYPSAWDELVEAGFVERRPLDRSVEPTEGHPIPTHAILLTQAGVDRLKP